jgi:hypothetical protein
LVKEENTPESIRLIHTARQDPGFCWHEFGEHQRLADRTAVKKAKES